jgi:DNA-binding NarL/FixJ family response regulator
LKPVRVLILEDDEATRTRIFRALESSTLGLQVVWSGPTAEAALTWLEEMHAVVDVALVDLGLPGLSGPEMVRKLRQCAPHMTIVALTIFDDAHTVLSVMKAGAVGYLAKYLTDEALAEVTVAAAKGGSPMTPHIARVLLDAWHDFRNNDPFESLTPREQEVLALLGAGLTYAAIGTKLGIGLGTVQGYVKNVYAKLSINSKAEAAALARRRGLLS